MKHKNFQSFNGQQTEYFLEESDFDYLNSDFNSTKDSLGFDLVSKINPKYSIHIGQYGIKYDWDVSELRMMIATHRIDIPVRLLSSVGSTPHEYKKYLPTTTKQLEALIDEFKYKGYGNVTGEDVVEFLKNSLVV